MTSCEGFQLQVTHFVSLNFLLKTSLFKLCNPLTEYGDTVPLRTFRIMQLFYVWPTQYFAWFTSRSQNKQRLFPYTT
jgi:hypothetical protein